MSFIVLIIGFILLIKCADWFVDACSNIAKSLGIPSLIIGLTIVALGTSAPEASVSITSSINEMNDISLGNVVGSNISNLLLVLGLGGLFGRITVKKKVLTRDFLYMLFASFLLLILTFIFFLSNEQIGIITRTNGIMLLAFLGLYLYVLTKDMKHQENSLEEKVKFKFEYIVFSLISLLGIIFGGQLVVNSAVIIANKLNVSQNVIALTIIAIGTSLPEIVTSVMAIKKGESDIAIGNILGSNIFNIFFVLGLASAISPITFGIETFYDVLFM